MTSSLIKLICANALLLALLVPGAVASVLSYDVGTLANPGGGDDVFSASWLHDASSSLDLLSGSPENGAYRTGKLSGAVSGSLHGTYDGQKLTGIGGTLSGNLSRLLKTNNPELKNKDFTLTLGVDIGSTQSGGLLFETNGAGTGQFTGGFLDYLLVVKLTDQPDFTLAGTFFFKPQSETGSHALSPNRGDASAFTLWGYNWMHDGGPIDPTSDEWLDFLADLGYEGGNVTRASVDQPLGIALYANNPEPPTGNSVNPEPTTFLVWAGLAMIGFGFAPRKR